MSRLLAAPLLFVALVACATGERDPSDPAAGGASGSTADTGTGGGLGVGGGTPGDEPCDGLDNDGDGAVDEGCPCQQGATQPCYGGPPAVAGVGACTEGTQSCGSGELSTWGPCEAWIAPVTEVCDAAAVDEDCDGSANLGCACEEGTSVPCGSDVGACEAGTQTCTGGMLGPCEGAVGPVQETCSGESDSDCDGMAGCDDPDCAGGPSCNTDCGDGVCAAGETAQSCPCDCSACTVDAQCAQPTPYCCIPCQCTGPALQCVAPGNCCG